MKYSSVQLTLIGSEVLRWIRNILWFEYSQIIIKFYHFFNDFLKCLQEKFWVVFFLLNALLTSLSYIDFVPYVHFKTKQNLYLNEHALTARLIAIHISCISCSFF